MDSVQCDPSICYFTFSTITFIYLKAKHDRWGLKLVRQLVYFCSAWSLLGGWTRETTNFPLCSHEVTKAGAQLHTDRAH